MKDVRRRKFTLSMENLRVAYDRVVALECPDVQVQAGTLAVLGHNGAGKSTLIKAALGLLTPQRGSLAICAEESGPMQNSDMAFCPETGSIFEDISVEEYIRLWCRMKHRDAQYFKRGGAEVIGRLDIGPLLKRLGRELSKGQRRRVQTAIGFLCEPQLFLFDEPFDGLDVQKTYELAEIIRSYTDRMSFIISSHHMDVVERLADSALVLRNGRVAASGPIETVSSSLCGSSVIITRLTDSEKVLAALRESMQTSSISLIGNQITVCGPHADLPRVEAIVRKVDLNGVRVEKSKPTLADAMNYHLSRID